MNKFKICLDFFGGITYEIYKNKQSNNKKIKISSKNRSNT
jgi:hypothetical protein